MRAFLMLMPIYILGNLHCIGMCGPLVLLLGSHRYRWFYFLGRILSFGLAGLLAGLFGSVIQLLFAPYQLSAWITLGFGIVLGLGALLSFVPRSRLSSIKVPGFLGVFERKVAQLMLSDRRWPIFLFGLFTILLPCGQTLVVYSALAVEGEVWSGLLNGILFAFLTSPSLIAAMHAGNWASRLKGYYRPLIGAAALLIAILTICRGLAEIEWIPHLIVHPEYHIVLY